MCGICGIVHFDPNKPIAESRIRSMMDLIQHRGPDDSGVFMGDHIGLGFRRLSIIDLQSGHQPMSNEDDSIWIVFNGEIYNHRSLRSQLQRAGHQFKTESDTESIIHLYEEYGTECVKHLRGMFAFAIWDKRKRRLFCARDRFGIKPFFYHINEEGFVFGSEIKNILVALNNAPTLSTSALDQYLAFGYSAEKGTIYDEIRKLPPAHTLLIEADGTVRIDSYWSIKYNPDPSLTEADWCRLIEEKLSDAVRSHMISDVPLGAFLSGGIDSSSVVALMSRHSETPLKTFSIGFKEAAFNELEYARMVAEKYQTEHYEQIVEPESVSMLPTLIKTYDEPFADASAIPTFFVSKFAREHVKVVLSGDGGDELFLGYNKYSKLKRFHDFNPIPNGLSPAIWGGIHSVIPRGMKGKGATYYLSKSRKHLPAYQALWQMDERQRLFRPGVWMELQKNYAEHKRFGYMDADPNAGFLFNMQKLDMRTYLVDDILTKVDRASMHHSLEVRVPILDHEFAELSFKIPSGLKLKGGEKKYILKKAMEELLPAPVLQHKKQGFSVPLKYWFKNELKDYVNDRLLDSNSPLNEFFNPGYIESIIKNHNQAMRDFNHKIWSLIVLDEWLVQTRSLAATKQA